MKVKNGIILSAVFLSFLSGSAVAGPPSDSSKVCCSSVNILTPTPRNSSWQYLGKYKGQQCHGKKYQDAKGTIWYCGPCFGHQCQ